MYKIYTIPTYNIYIYTQTQYIIHTYINMQIEKTYKYMNNIHNTYIIHPKYINNTHIHKTCKIHI